MSSNLLLHFSFFTTLNQLKFDFGTASFPYHTVAALNAQPALSNNQHVKPPELLPLHSTFKNTFFHPEIHPFHN